MEKTYTLYYNNETLHKGSYMDCCKHLLDSQPNSVHYCLTYDEYKIK